MNNPTFAAFTSPQHNTNQPNGQPYVTEYRVSTFPTNDPTGTPQDTAVVAKDDARISHQGEDNYRVDIVGLLVTPQAGWLFVRSERSGAAGEAQGPYGAGAPFQLGVVALVPIDVTALG